MVYSNYPVLFTNRRLTGVQGSFLTLQPKVVFQSHTCTKTNPPKKHPPHLTAEQTVTHPSIPPNIQSHLIPGERGKGKRTKERRIKGVYFKFRPTVHLRLAAFPHAPDRHNPSTTPSSPTSSGEPSPSANGKDRLTSCLPLTLRITPPPPSGRPPNRQAIEDRCKQPEHLTQRAHQTCRQSDSRRERPCMAVGGGDQRMSRSPFGHWNSRFTRGVCK